MSSSPNRYKQHGGIQVGFLIGLFIGIVLTGVISVSMFGASVESQAPTPTTPTTPPPAPQVTIPPPAPVTASVPTDTTPTNVDTPNQGSMNIPGLGVPTQAEPTTPSASTGAENFYLQVGAYRVVEQAEAFKNRLTNLGFNTIIQTGDLEGVPIYRVRVGPFAEMSEVDEVRTQLTAQQIDASLVRLN